jgi:hypothetical protein
VGVAPLADCRFDRDRDQGNKKWLEAEIPHQGQLVRLDCEEASLIRFGFQYQPAVIDCFGQRVDE